MKSVKDKITKAKEKMNELIKILRNAGPFITKKLYFDGVTQDDEAGNKPEKANNLAKLLARAQRAVQGTKGVYADVKGAIQKKNIVLGEI